MHMQCTEERLLISQHAAGGGSGGGGSGAGAGGDESSKCGKATAADAVAGDAATPDEDLAADAGGGSADFVPHVVTEEEAAAGTYSAEDVLLPLPGHKVIYPSNAVAAEYDRLMEEQGLSTASLLHRVKELALPGGYRKLMQRPQAMTWRILKYDDPNLPLAATDLSTIRGEPAPEGVPGGQLTAAVLEFILPSSTYATMCLRELTKQSTEVAHQKSLNSAAAAVDWSVKNWTCPECGADVFANKTACYKCKAPKPPPPEEEADGEAAKEDASGEAVGVAAATTAQATQSTSQTQC